MRRPKRTPVYKLGRAVSSYQAASEWQILTQDEPAFAGLREDVRFKKMLADLGAHAAAEHEQLLKMRAQGLVPDRRK